MCGTHSLNSLAFGCALFGRFKVQIMHFTNQRRKSPLTRTREHFPGVNRKFIKGLLIKFIIILMTLETHIIHVYTCIYITHIVHVYLWTSIGDLELVEL